MIYSRHEYPHRKRSQLPTWRETIFLPCSLSYYTLLPETIDLYLLTFEVDTVFAIFKMRLLHENSD